MVKLPISYLYIIPTYLFFSSSSWLCRCPRSNIILDNKICISKAFREVRKSRNTRSFGVLYTHHTMGKSGHGSSALVLYLRRMKAHPFFLFLFYMVVWLLRFCITSFSSPLTQVCCFLYWTARAPPPERTTTNICMYMYASCSHYSYVAYIFLFMYVWMCTLHAHMSFICFSVTIASRPFCCVFVQGLLDVHVSHAYLLSFACIKRIPCVCRREKEGYSPISSWIQNMQK